MPVHTDIGIGIEVVAERPLAGDGVVIRRDVDVFDAEPFPFAVHEAARAQPRPVRGARRHPSMSPNTSSYVRFSLTIRTTCRTPAGSGRCGAGRVVNPLASITTASAPASSAGRGQRKIPRAFPAATGCGGARIFGPTPWPRAFVTNTVSRWMATRVGNQAAGKCPSTFFARVSITPTALMPASATSSQPDFSSIREADRQDAAKVFESRECGSGSRLRTWLVLASMIVMESFARVRDENAGPP